MRARSQLIGLGAIVLLVHGLLLAPTAPDFQPAPSPKAWTARTVPPVPAPAPVVTAVVPLPAPQTVARKPPARPMAEAAQPSPVAEIEPPQAMAAPEPSSPQPSTPLPVLLPAPRQLRYLVTGQSRGQAFQGAGELLWQHDGASYSARLQWERAPSHVAQPLLRVQTSEGQVDSAGLAPSRFGDRAQRHLAAHFERAQGLVVFSANTPSAPLQAGAQDRVSVLLQLAAWLAAAPDRYLPGSALRVQTVGAREAESWRFVVEPDEDLDLPAGRMPTRRLLRLPERPYDLRLEVWLSSNHDWLPVQLRMGQANGDFVQLALAAVNVP